MPILTNILQKAGKPTDQTQKARSKRDKDKGTRKNALAFAKKDKKDEKVAGKKEKKQSKKANGTSLIKGSAHTPYHLVVSPHISEKSVNQKGQDKYVFEVFPGAEAQQITRALESAYGVTIEKVNIVKVPHKKSRIRNRKRNVECTKSRYNKCIITLKKGQTLEILPK